MPTKQMSINFNGNKYTWNGSFWYDSKTFMIPSSIVAGNLTKELSKQLGIKPNIVIESNHAQ